MAKLKIYLTLFAASIAVFSCENIENAKPTDRSTFLRIIEKRINYQITTAEPLANGFVLGGNASAGLDYYSYVTNLDNQGNVLSEIEIKGSSISSIKVTENGYLVFGNSIQANDTAKNINDQFVTQALIVKMTPDLNIQSSKKIFDSKNPLTDYNGLAINLDGSGKILISGTKKQGSLNADAFVAACDPSTLDTLWFRSYEYLNHEYVTTRNIFGTSTGAILWAASLQRISQTQTRAYLSTSTTATNGSYKSADFFGQQLTSNRLILEEIQPTFGAFGAVGTFSDTQGKNGNVFFIRIGVDGRFDTSSIKTFDGETGFVTISNASEFDNAPQSASDDVGRSICSTENGGYLLGNSLTTTLNRGKGGKDIWLVRLDALGNVVWDKVYGGPGDEIVNVVRPLTNGNFLVAGGTVNNGLTSAFIMIIDANGQIVK